MVKNREAWCTAVHGVTKSWTWLSDWTTKTLHRSYKIRVTKYRLDILLSQFWTSPLLMPSSNCFFLTCIQISQEAGQVVWYSHLFKNFPQFLVTHTVKGFRVVNEAEVDDFWNSLSVSLIQQMSAIWALVPLPFLNLACTFWKCSIQVLLKPGLGNFEH